MMLEQSSEPQKGSRTLRLVGIVVALSLVLVGLGYASKNMHGVDLVGRVESSSLIVDVALDEAKISQIIGSSDEEKSAIFANVATGGVSDKEELAKLVASGDIAYGQSARNGEFPFVVQLSITGNGMTGVCTGTLVSLNWVLTAAHCMEYYKIPANDASKVVAYAGSNARNQGVQRKGAEWKLAPWSPNVHDVALVRVESPFPATHAIYPIGLGFKEASTVPASGSVGVVVGWGVDQLNQFPKELKYAKMRVYYPGNANCAGIDVNEICGIYPNSDTTGHFMGGDSGGPLFRDIGGQAILWGVSVWSHGNKYTWENVQKYYTWIEGVISASSTEYLPNMNPYMAYGDRLSGATSQKLLSGQFLLSKNGKYIAIQQLDGNFVVYSPTSPVWNTGNSVWNWHTRSGNWMVMQSDNNLVQYSKTNVPIFASHTHNVGSKPAVLIMQDDRNLVIYDANSRPIWHSNTWTRQTDEEE